MFLGIDIITDLSGACIIVIKFYVQGIISLFLACNYVYIITDNNIIRAYNKVIAAVNNVILTDDYIVFSVNILKVLRYSKSFNLIISVVKREKKGLIAVGVLAGGYILLSALIMFQVEPESFESFFDAIYWAVVTLTTVGYGDIYPTSDIGRIVSMLSSFMGIAIVALPTGIITAGYMNELNKSN